MRTRTLIASAVLALAISAAAAFPALAQMTPSEVARDNGVSDKAAFDHIRQQQADAWYKEDGTSFSATFTEDADFVTFNGDYLRTRSGIRDGLQYYFDNYMEPTQIKYLDEHVRYSSRNVVTIVRKTCLVAEGSTDCRDGSLSFNTNVLVRQHGQWLQSSFQNTRIQPIT